MPIAAGMERLSEKSRLERLRSRHRDFYLAMADEAEAGLWGPDQKQWRQIVQTEYDNFLQALQWSLESEDADSALRLARAVDRVLYLRGEEVAGEPWIRKALALPAPPSSARVGALLALAEVRRSVGATQEATELRKEAVQVARACGDRKAEVDAMARLAGTPAFDVFPASEGGLSKSTELLEEALRIAKEIDYESGIAAVLWRLAGHRQRDDRWAEGRELSERALAIYRKLGNSESVGWLIYAKGWEEKDPIRAKQLALEALDIARDIEDTNLLACCFEQLMFQEEAAGDLAAARRWVQQWNEELRAMSRALQPWQEAWLLGDWGHLDVVQGRWHDARRRLEHAIDLTAGRYLFEERHSSMLLARAHLELEGYELARATAARGLELARETKHFVGQALYYAAVVAMAAGDVPAAREMAQEAVELANPRWILDVADELLIQAALEEGDLEAAGRNLENLLNRNIHHYAARWEPSRRDLIRAKVARHAGQLDEARDLLAAAASDLLRLQHPVHFASVLEEAAALHEATGDSDTAAKILGAAKALRERIEYPVPQVNRRSYARLVEKVRSDVGDEAFDEAFREGRHLSDEEALALVASSSRGVSH